jgi:hypothetical protein
MKLPLPRCYPASREVKSARSALCLVKARLQRRASFFGVLANATSIEGISGLGLPIGKSEGITTHAERFTCWRLNPEVASRLFDP